MLNTAQHSAKKDLFKNKKDSKVQQRGLKKVQVSQYKRKNTYL